MSNIKSFFAKRSGGGCWGSDAYDIIHTESSFSACLIRFSINLMNLKFRNVNITFDLSNVHSFLFAICLTLENDNTTSSANKK